MKSNISRKRYNIHEDGYGYAGIGALYRGKKDGEVDVIVMAADLASLELFCARQGWSIDPLLTERMVAVSPDSVTPARDPLEEGL